MTTQRDQSKPVLKQLRSWWHTLLGRWGLTGKPKSQGSERLVTDSPNSVRNSHVVVRPYCRHGKMQKVAAKVFLRLIRRTSKSEIEDLCPICGLLPKGDRAVEYVLRVWFTDGDIYDYSFRDKDPDRCYRISDGVLEIFLGDSVLTYSVDYVTTVQFGPHEIPADPPEVVEAERILADLERRQG